MQLINHWPSANDISLPDVAKQALLAHLIEPFGGQGTAKTFWHDYPSMIIIITKNDVNESVLLLDDEIQHQVEFAHSNPEYEEHLSAEYIVKLSITSDEGNGVYLITPAGFELPNSNKVK
tara:strand:- start:55 stop:414 length:360 start_codon:yes stop_codon:yes gene_type:complete